MSSSLWVGTSAARPSQALDGHTLSRPSWSLDDAVWVVVDGNNVVRVIQEAASGSRPGSRWTPPRCRQVPRPDLRTAAVPRRHPRGDGDQWPGDPAPASSRPGGQFALTYPRRLGLRAGLPVVSLSWRTGDDIVVTRNDPKHPVSYVNLDGVNSDAPSAQLTGPVTTIAANPSTVYVADPRGVMQLSPRPPKA